MRRSGLPQESELGGKSRHSKRGHRGPTNAAAAVVLLSCGCQHIPLPSSLDKPRPKHLSVRRTKHRLLADRFPIARTSPRVNQNSRLIGLLFQHSQSLTMVKAIESLDEFKALVSLIGIDESAQWETFVDWLLV